MTNLTKFVSIVGLIGFLGALWLGPKPFGPVFYFLIIAGLLISMIFRRRNGITLINASALRQSSRYVYLAVTCILISAATGFSCMLLLQPLTASYVALALFATLMFALGCFFGAIAGRAAKTPS